MRGLVSRWAAALLVPIGPLMSVLSGLQSGTTASRPGRGGATAAVGARNPAAKRRVRIRGAGRRVGRGERPSRSGWRAGPGAVVGVRPGTGSSPLSRRRVGTGTQVEASIVCGPTVALVGGRVGARPVTDHRRRKIGSSSCTVLDGTMPNALSRTSRHISYWRIASPWLPSLRCIRMIARCALSLRGSR